MGAYNRTKRTYYTIGYGKFRHKETNGEIQEYDVIDGILDGIQVRKHEISSGEEKTFVDFQFKDGDEIFIISCEKYGTNCNTILRCLPNIPDFKQKIVLEAWQGEGKDGKTHTNLTIRQNEDKIQWVEIPEKEKFRLPNGEVVLSSKAREAYLDGIIKQINERLSGKSGNADAPGAEEYPGEEGAPYIPNEVDEQ